MAETLGLPILPKEFFWEIQGTEPTRKSIEIRKVRFRFWSHKIISTPLDLGENNTIVSPADEIFNKAAYIYEAFKLINRSESTRVKTNT